MLTFDLPPLRQRPEDVRLLAEHFFDLARQQAGLPVARLSNEAVRRLESHDWPGNVRELRNTINRAVISDMERTHILEAIARAGGNKAEAARLLGIARSTLLRKLQQFKEGT